MLEERFELAYNRIIELQDEVDSSFSDYIKKTAKFIIDVCDVYKKIKENTATIDDYKKWNEDFYNELMPENYEESYGNPQFCSKEFGDELGGLLCWYYSNTRDIIFYAYEGKQKYILLYMELFLQTVSALEEEEPSVHELKENLYFYIHDYQEEKTEESVKNTVCFDENNLIYKIIMESDFSSTDYLYKYGDYISDNELKVQKHLYSLSEDKLNEIAFNYTDGFKRGFEIAGIDLSKKETVQIRYNIGFEPIVRCAVQQFEKLGLKPIFKRSGNTGKLGVVTTGPNRQYVYDHRFDDALYLNKALVKHRLSIAKNAFEKYKEQAKGFAGPAVIETFGEKLFVPKSKKEAAKYSDEQEKLSIEFKRDYVLMQNEYIPQDEYSFTIVAYPIPEIGEKFSEIFDETVKINLLPLAEYEKIHQALIDTLDKGEYVNVTGRDGNKTDINIMLHKLTNPKTQTNFENCLADVNIPVGEVFTSPILTNTKGKLHVKQVYLNGLRYENLEIDFEDGYVKNYTCTNYENEDENKAYIKENVLHNHDSLPIGEFAIGTNTTAYVIGRKYDIEAKLPILIAEKTGPHFALGDTCYSMQEDMLLKNPDGKEIIAKENETSALRKTDISKAYFNCHTDITIPYDELGDIKVVTSEGEMIIIIQDGRFVLPGTEGLNKVFE